MAPVKGFDRFLFHHIKKRENPFEGYKTETEYQERSHVIDSFPELFYRNRQVTVYTFLLFMARIVGNLLLTFQTYYMYMLYKNTETLITLEIKSHRKYFIVSTKYERYIYDVL